MQASRTLLVINKIDLPCGLSPDDVRLLDGLSPMRVSALTGEGLPHLEQTIVDRTWRGEVAPAAEIIVTNVRHKNAILQAADAVAECLRALSDGAPEEVMAEYLRTALNSLGEITGDTATQDIINHIFDSFCIGK
jgi:tRNA modification GTPase